MSVLDAEHHWCGDPHPHDEHTWSTSGVIQVPVTCLGMPEDDILIDTATRASDARHRADRLDRAVQVDGLSVYARSWGEGG